ncbi:MAG TPA: hypothetical protein VGR37_07960 [Longimicrobiaceae bacterium]|nr:hypothetical protein [Longimicrobiaceae bacterium]
MTRRFLLPLVASLLALAGCSDHAAAPLSPEPAAPAALLDATIDLDGVLEFATLPDLTAPRSVSKRITAAEGGSVELAGFRVDVPAGALPQDTVISIVLPSDATLGKRVLAEFEPHGIRFNTPVTISFPLQGVLLPTGGALDVGRWENGGWTSLGGTVSPDGTRLFSTTPHFSTYSARGGAYTMAGG